MDYFYIVFFWIWCWFVHMQDYRLVIFLAPRSVLYNLSNEIIRWEWWTLSGNWDLSLILLRGTRILPLPFLKVLGGICFNGDLGSIAQKDLAVEYILILKVKGNGKSTIWESRVRDLSVMSSRFKPRMNSKICNVSFHL